MNWKCSLSDANKQRIKTASYYSLGLIAISGLYYVSKSYYYSTKLSTLSSPKTKQDLIESNTQKEELKEELKESIETVL